MKKKVLYLKTILAPTLGSRDVTSTLSRVLTWQKEKHIELDFSDIDFISRSAAHELLLLRFKLQRRIFRKKTIKFVNFKDNVRQVLETVHISWLNIRKKKPSLPHLHIDRVDATRLFQLKSI